MYDASRIEQTRCSWRTNSENLLYGLYRDGWSSASR